VAGPAERQQNRPVSSNPSPIRAAGSDELESLQDIEVAAGRLFADIGLASVAEDPPLPVEELAKYQRQGRAWVYAESEAGPVGYLLAGRVDGNAHIDQVSVHPAFGHRRIGRRLIDHLIRWAGEEGLPAVTLTTFATILWNAPYYQRCGFRVMDEVEMGPELARLRLAERDRGLDTQARVAMIREV
jgi:ribosomal protein S18 acetylase RimI-like enzyme